MTCEEISRSPTCHCLLTTHSLLGLASVRQREGGRGGAAGKGRRLHVPPPPPFLPTRGRVAEEGDNETEQELPLCVWHNIPGCRVRSKSDTSLSPLHGKLEALPAFEAHPLATTATSSFSLPTAGSTRQTTQWRHDNEEEEKEEEGGTAFVFCRRLGGT